MGTGWGRGGGTGHGVVRDSGRMTRSRARGRTPRVLSAEPMALSVLLSDPAPPPPPPCGVRNTGSGEPIPTPSSPPARRASDAPAVSSSSPAMAKPTVRLIGCAIVRRASHACARAMRSRGGGQRAGRARRRGERQAAPVFWTARGGGQQNTHALDLETLGTSRSRDVILVSHAGFDRRASSMKRTCVRSHLTQFSGQNTRGTAYAGIAASKIMMMISGGNASAALLRAHPQLA